VSYASLEDFKLWFAGSTAGGTRLSDYFQSTDEADQDTMIQQALEEATGIMDGAFSIAGYATPVDPASAEPCTSLLRKLCIDLALEGIARPGVVAIPEGIKEAKSKTVAFLEGLQGQPEYTNDGVLRMSNPRYNLPGIARVA